MDEIIIERITDVLDELEELKKQSNGAQLIAQQQRKISELEAHIATQDEQIEKLILQNEELLNLEGKEQELTEKNKALSAKLNAKSAEADKLRHELELVNGEYKKAIREIQSTLGSVANIDREAINNSARSIDNLMRVLATHSLAVAGAFLFCLVSALASAYTAWKFHDYDGILSLLQTINSNLVGGLNGLYELLNQ